MRLMTFCAAAWLVSCAPCCLDTYAVPASERPEADSELSFSTNARRCRRCLLGHALNLRTATMASIHDLHDKLLSLILAKASGSAAVQRLVC
ncbi:hypothetical protein WJX72_003915 [[Myrmecia] bisecta]|uniref:Secreted protein n=1 Tax=[Myrmecia] bisecta TaxID=41462 RepID=A0AAW1P802_9CHLO